MTNQENFDIDTVTPFVLYEVSINDFVDQIHNIFQKYSKDAIFKLVANNEYLNTELYFSTADIDVRINDNLLSMTIGATIIFLRPEQVYYLQKLQPIEENAEENVCMVVYDLKTREVFRLYLPNSANGNDRADVKHASNNTAETNAYIDKGDSELLQGNYRSAINNYSEAINSRPDDASLFVLRADAYFQQGRFDQSIADLDEAVRICPENSDYYIKRGKTYLAKGIYYAAKADFEKALKIDPRNYIKTII